MITFARRNAAGLITAGPIEGVAEWTFPESARFMEEVEAWVAEGNVIEVDESTGGPANQD